jgi:hypothetical protein
VGCLLSKTIEANSLIVTNGGDDDGCDNVIDVMLLLLRFFVAYSVKNMMCVLLKKVCSNSPQGADLLTEKRAEDGRILRVLNQSIVQLDL